jgi:hypothetical protein
MTVSTPFSRSGNSSSRGMRYGMPAPAIFRLARVMRWDTVDSGARNAAAICAVVRPQTTRRVRAI